MTQQTFLRRHRFTIARRITELLVLMLFAGSARWGWEIAGKPLLLGDLSQSKILGMIPLGDPLAFLERLLAGIIPTATTLIGTALITLFYSLLGSRTFCGWVCPLNGSGQSSTFRPTTSVCREARAMPCLQAPSRRASQPEQQHLSP